MTMITLGEARRRVASGNYQTLEREVAALKAECDKLRADIAQRHLDNKDIWDRNTELRQENDELRAALVERDKAVEFATDVLCRMNGAPGTHIRASWKTEIQRAIVALRTGAARRLANKDGA